MNIVDYLRVPKRERDVGLRKHSLAMLFEGEMVDGISLRHEVRVRFLDANGQSVLPEGDSIHNLDFQPLSENRLGRRDALDLPEDLRLTPGDYVFEIYMDGQHQGTRDLLVFKSK